MNLLNLANELLIKIAEYLDDPRYLYFFLRANQRLTRLLSPSLYSLIARSEYALIAFFSAAASGNEAMLRFLLEEGPNIVVKEDSKVALHLAPAKCNDTTISRVLAKGANIIVRKRLSRYIFWEGPAICWAARVGHKSMVQFLLKKGADISGSDREGSTPLHYATQFRDVPFASFLIDQGAEIFVRDSFGRSALGRVAHKFEPGETKGSDREILKLFLDRSPVSMRYECGMMPLHLAALHFGDDVSLIKSLLERGADIEEKSQCLCGATALLHAARVGNKKIVSLLISWGATIVDSELETYSPTHITTPGKQAQMAKMLLECVPPDFRDSNGRTALHLMSQALHADDCRQLSLWDEDERHRFIRTLLDKGLNINAKDITGCTPLHTAVWFGNLSAVKLLIQYGADVNSMNEHAYTILHGALTPSKCDVQGICPAFKRDIEEIFNLVLDKGFDINNHAGGRIPMLHLLASRPNRHFLIPLLIKRGVDQQASVDGQTALDLAIQCGGHSSEIIALFRGKADGL